MHSCIKLSYTDHNALQIHSISLHSSDFSVVGKKKCDKCSLCIYLLYVRELSSFGRRPDLEWGRAEIDNGAAKWPLSWNVGMERKPLYSLYILLSLSFLSPGGGRSGCGAWECWQKKIWLQPKLTDTTWHRTKGSGDERGVSHKLFLARSR